VGHILHQTTPDTAPWHRVVRHIADGDSVAKVAQATTQAAAAGLELAHGDTGISKTVYLLTQVALAARQPDFAGALRAAGIPVPDTPGVVDLAVAFGTAVERAVRAQGGRTDVGEMARLSAIESLTGLLTNGARNLFGTTPEAVQEAARGYSTDAGFGRLFHEFYSGFAQRFLTYHLGRELPLHVGGNSRFADPGAHNRFLADLGQHCRQAALIVKAFANEWYSKHNFLGGITPTKAKHFANYCVTKLRHELLLRGAQDA
jgi:hypothetical protein